MGLRMIKERGLTLLVSDKLMEAGARHAFTTRRGGVSGGEYASLNLRISCGDDPENVYENYDLLAEAVGFSRENVVMSRQVHSSSVRRADAGEGLFRPDRPDADGVISDNASLALMVFTADCTPVLIFDPATGAAAAVHAGWRGTAAGIAGRAVERLAEEYGAEPRRLVAAIGPHISRDRFETGPEVAEAMLRHFGDAAAPLCPKRGEKFFPDLGMLNFTELERAGLRAENIDLDTRCTMCEPEYFFSHRRTGGRRGVQGAVIMPGRTGR